MKSKMAAALLLVVGLGTASAFAEDGYWRHRDIRQDRREIAHDRHEMRRDLWRGDYAGARHEEREIRAERRDIYRDRHWDGDRYRDGESYRDHYYGYDRY